MLFYHLGNSCCFRFVCASLYTAAGFPDGLFIFFHYDVQDSVNNRSVVILNINATGITTTNKKNNFDDFNFTRKRYSIYSVSYWKINNWAVGILNNLPNDILEYLYHIDIIT